MTGRLILTTSSVADFDLTLGHIRAQEENTWPTGKAEGSGNVSTVDGVYALRSTDNPDLTANETTTIRI